MQGMQNGAIETTSRAVKQGANAHNARKRRLAELSRRLILRPNEARTSPT